MNETTSLKNWRVTLTLDEVLFQILDFLAIVIFNKNHHFFD